MHHQSEPGLEIWIIAMSRSFLTLSSTRFEIVSAQSDHSRAYLEYPSATQNTHYRDREALWQEKRTVVTESVDLLPTQEWANGIRSRLVSRWIVRKSHGPVGPTPEDESLQDVPVLTARRSR